MPPREKEIAKGAYVTVDATGEGGRVVGLDHDGTSGQDFVRVALDSGRTAYLLERDVTVDERYAQP